MEKRKILLLRRNISSSPQYLWPVVRFPLQDKQLFYISEVKIRRVDCIWRDSPKTKDQDFNCQEFNQIYYHWPTASSRYTYIFIIAGWGITNFAKGGNLIGSFCKMSYFLQVLSIIYYMYFNPCHTHFYLSANQITWSRLLIQIHIVNDKQCSSRSVKKPTDLDLHFKARAYPGSAGLGLGFYNPISLSFAVIQFFL